jgi:uncharacterized protein
LKIVVVLVAGALAATGAARGETVQGLPAPTGYVNDFAGVLTPETRQSIEELCSEEDALAHAQIAVVTIKTIDPDKSGATPSIEEFATALEDKWKVGTKGTDRGVLMIFVMNPRRGRIEVGYGLEGILNDAKVGRILDPAVSSASSGDYDQAITTVVQGLANVIAADKGVALTPTVHRYHRESAQPQRVGIGQIVLGVGFLLLILILVLTGHAGWAFYLVLNLLGGGGGSGRDDDDRGGGFGGIGGGSSGGGGASRDF